jgi:hypothetical protein
MNRLSYEKMNVQSSLSAVKAVARLSSVYRSFDLTKISDTGLALTSNLKRHAGTGDVMSIEIESDGAITVRTDDISENVHQAAEEFLEVLAERLGAKVQTQIHLPVFDKAVCQ